MLEMFEVQCNKSYISLTLIADNANTNFSNHKYVSKRMINKH